MPFIHLPDAEAQCAALAELIRPQLRPNTLLVGIHSGGAWIARRLSELLGLPGEIGLIDVSFYRDDFSKKGLHPPVSYTHLDVYKRQAMARTATAPSLSTRV